MPKYYVSFKGAVSIEANSPEESAEIFKFMDDAEIGSAVGELEKVELDA
jgi:hypothetical protein